MKMMRIIDEEIDQTHHYFQHFNLNACWLAAAAGPSIYIISNQKKKTLPISIKSKGKKEPKIRPHGLKKSKRSEKWASKAI